MVVKHRMSGPQRHAAAGEVPNEVIMSKLLEPLRVGELELPNRVVMAPLTRNRATVPERAPKRADA
jgi:hypothetical protein